jgi:uncharacterized DUF497 family protein
MSFLWNPLKAAANVQLHGVTFEEAESIFRDPLAVTVEDQIHSELEPREIIIGHSDKGRLLFVCFTERAEGIRLISAREATRTERKNYEDNHDF